MNKSRTYVRPVIVVAGTAAALAVWALAGPVAGLDLEVRQGASTRQVGGVSVAVAGLLAGLAAWGLLALLERTAKNPARIWTIIAGAVLVLSLPGPFAGAVEITGGLLLAALHLTVGAILIPGLARTSAMTPTARPQHT